MSFSSIVMSYKENCKTEGEIMTKFKIARMYFAEGKTQFEINQYLKCHKNTICGIIAACNNPNHSYEIRRYLYNKNMHISIKKLAELFVFFKHGQDDPRAINALLR